MYVDAPELGIIPSATLDTRHGYYSKRLRHRHAQEAAPEGDQRRVELVTFQRKPSLVAESFRAAVASILFSGENGNHPRVIVITSPAPKEGKTTVTTNLALALSEINRRVLLIDADVLKAPGPADIAVIIDTVQSAVQRFTEDGTTVIGTILNDWNPKKHQGYGYGYTYRSYHGYYDSYQKHYGPDSEKK